MCCKRDSKKNGIYNVGTGIPRSFKDIVDILQKELKTDFTIDYFENPYEDYQYHTQADISSVCENLGFKPNFSLEQGIKNYLADITQVSIQDLTIAIAKLADVRAENGAEQNRLNVATELLMQNQTNLEAANGRIVDADMALESTRMARQNVLVQSSAAMLAQANQLTGIILQVLG